ncbi:alpha/beta-hydrolase [Biscogniauxia mediterranea]|nr:alpha/beta-hydrolase [Biscogniauxia mediterranea]
MTAEVGATVATGAAAATAEEIKPYKLHVSSKYLDLTRQKLEITRLPHEVSEPKSEDWWEPKSQIEPVIDFWLEQYSWRAQEDALNKELPQFRTSFTIASSKTPIRTHFVHIRSPHANAIPLLLIPPFPFSNLSFGHLVKPLTDPEDVASNQPFHLVIPSLQGVGFSDAFPNNTPVISTSAEILDALMKRLSYSYYLVTNAGSGAASPAEIDYKLANCLSTRYQDSCLGTHFISPPLARPKLKEAPVQWAKWSVASALKAPVFGYSRDDFPALKRSGGYARLSKKPKTKTDPMFGLNQFELREPNTLAYALCDSPTGLLVFVLKSLRLLGAQRDFTPTEMINFTQLAWLPGPEAAMRFWAYCASHPETAPKKTTSSRPKVAVTVFLGNELKVHDAEKGAPNVEGVSHFYPCPSWANARYNVVYTQRASGKPGFIPLDRPEIIATGVRRLAASILKTDARLRPAPEPAAASTPQVVAEVAATGGPPAKAPAEPTPAPPQTEARRQPRRALSDETAVASDETLTGKPSSPTQPAFSPTQ